MSGTSAIVNNFEAELDLSTNLDFSCHACSMPPMYYIIRARDNDIQSCCDLTYLLNVPLPLYDVPRPLALPALIGEKPPGSDEQRKRYSKIAMYASLGFGTKFVLNRNFRYTEKRQVCFTSKFQIYQEREKKMRDSTQRDREQRENGKKDRPLKVETSENKSMLGFIMKNHSMLRGNFTNSDGIMYF